MFKNITDIVLVVLGLFVVVVGVVLYLTANTEHDQTQAQLTVVTGGLTLLFVGK